MKGVILLISTLVALEGLVLVTAPRRVVEFLRELTPNEVRGCGLITMALAAALIYVALLA